MPDSQDDRRKVNFPREGILILCDKSGVEIQVTDYHARPLKVAWDTIDLWRSEATGARSLWASTDLETSGAAKNPTTRARRRRPRRGRPRR